MYIEIRIWLVQLQIGLRMLEKPKKEEPTPPKNKAGFQPNA